VSLPEGDSGFGIHSLKNPEMVLFQAIELLIMNVAANAIIA